MSTTLLVGLAFGCATVPAVLWVWNMLLYREPGCGSCSETGHCVLPDAVSVLIPARNEERVIAASITSLLASRGVQIEIIVLDDASTDRTAAIVRDFAARDSRVHLQSSPCLLYTSCVRPVRPSAMSSSAVGPQPKRVAIVGGGISGLATAYQLACEGVGFTLFEASGRLGGIVETVRSQEFVIECGPDSWVTEKPWARELAVELGLEDQIIPSNDPWRRTYVLQGGDRLAQLVPIPDGMPVSYTHLCV